MQRTLSILHRTKLTTLSLSLRTTNCMSDKMQSNKMQSEDWIQRWDNRQIGFHKEFVHPLLIKHVDSLTGGNSNLKVFVPLCGKSLDMKWLTDQGHTVVGVEVAEKAIEEFFQEQSIPFTKQPLPGVKGTLYQSEDKKLLLYCCDAFDISKELVGAMDAVWDRASLVAINRDDRPRYASLLKSLMSPGSRYLLAVLQYDETIYGGPPHNVSDEAVHSLFDDSCNVKQIDDVDAFEERMRENWGLTSMREKVFLIMPK